MAKSTIDLFPLVKQRKADVSLVPCLGKLMILAKSGCGLWRDTAEVHYLFRREIKEDI